MPLSADRSYTIQEQFSLKPAQGYTMFLPTWLGLGAVGNKIPPYGDSRRDAYLADYWKMDPILAGAINTIIKRMKSTGYTIEGGRNNTVKWARKLQMANDGRGWQDFITRWVQDYETTDLGAIIEIGTDGQDNPQGIYNLDSVCCGVYPSFDYPLVYQQPFSGRIVKLPRRNIIHLSDMTSPREIMMGRGFCAVSRMTRAAESISAIYDYELQKLGKLPPLAIASIAGVSKEQFFNQWELYLEQRKQAGNDIYTGIFWIGGDDPNIPIKIDITDLASLPDQFDRNAMLESWVKTVALNLGVDVGELWLIQHVGATKGSQTVQHQKALGKGTGEIHSMLEMALNVRVLPADVTFEFDFQDDEQDQLKAEIMMTKINNLIALYTQSSRGPATTGGIEAPFGRSGAGNVNASQTGQKPEGSTGSSGPTGQATTTPPQNIVDQTPPLISRDQAIDLGTRWGIFPPGFFGQEVMTIAGMILKDMGYDTSEEHIIVTHDMKVYKPDMDARKKVHRDNARMLLSRLKETKTEELLVGKERDALEYLAGL